jgi:hypothetical protein
MVIPWLVADVRSYKCLLCIFSFDAYPMLAFIRTKIVFAVRQLTGKAEKNDRAKSSYAIWCGIADDDVVSVLARPGRTQTEISGKWTAIFC